jgi:FMN-dependent NADH-azoreductase
MPTLLQIDSSASGTRSRSRMITAEFADAWRRLGPDYVVAKRDLHVAQPPHLPSSSLHWPAGVIPGSRESSWETRQQQYIREVIDADVLLVAVPMYNYSMPSTLKAWIDHIHVPGVLAGLPTDQLPMRNKPAVLVSTRGAAYGGSDNPQDWDHGTAAVEIVLAQSMGMNPHRIVTHLTLADDLEALANRRDEGRQSLENALAEARRLATQLGGFSTPA